MSTTISQTDHQTDDPDGFPFDVDHGAADQGDATPDQPFEPAAPVVVRRNAGFAALVGAAASAIAIAYLWRATQSAAPLDWALCAVMAAVGAIYLAHLVDARTPLLVADDLGVRIRLGRQWRGLPWDAVQAVVVTRRRGLFRDGRLVFSPHNLERALDGLDGRGRRAAAMNKKVYGAALAVPLGLTTRVSAPGSELAGRLAALSEERAEIIEATPQTPDEPEADDGIELEDFSPTGEVADDDTQSFAPEWFAAEPVETEPDAEIEAEIEADADADAEADGAPAQRKRRGLGALVAWLAKSPAKDLDRQPGGEPTDQDPELGDWDDEADPEEDLEPDTDDEHAEPESAVHDEPGLPGIPEQPTAWSRSVHPLRMRRRGPRTVEAPAAEAGAAALAPNHDVDAVRPTLPESEVLRRIGDDDLDAPAVIVPATDRVRPIARLADPVEPLVIDDFVTEPASDPIIGPELAAARTRVGLSVDELADRTRIRPHVIESIEVDDFAPCGGDFYARGHLRTLARVLGRDPEPLLAMFDNRYATAPINARKVFEAELATTGTTSGMRRTVGGPNWALLIGVVLVLVLVWGVVRLFASEPQQVLQPSTPVLNGSAGVDQGPASKPQHGAVAVTPPKPMHVTLSGAQNGSHVVVRDKAGKVVWAGDIRLGEKRVVSALPPVKVQATVGGAVEAYVKGQDRGPVGTSGQPGELTLKRLHP